MNNQIYTANYTGELTPDAYHLTLQPEKKLAKLRKKHGHSYPKFVRTLKLEMRAIRTSLSNTPQLIAHIPTSGPYQTSISIGADTPEELRAHMDKIGVTPEQYDWETLKSSMYDVVAHASIHAENDDLHITITAVDQLQRNCAAYGAKLAAKAIYERVCQLAAIKSWGISTIGVTLPEAACSEDLLAAFQDVPNVRVSETEEYCLFVTTTMLSLEPLIFANQHPSPLGGVDVDLSNNWQIMNLLEDGFTTDEIVGRLREDAEAVRSRHVLGAMRIICAPESEAWDYDGPGGDVVYQSPSGPCELAFYNVRQSGVASERWDPIRAYRMETFLEYDAEASAVRLVKNEAFERNIRALGFGSAYMSLVRDVDSFLSRNGISLDAVQVIQLPISSYGLASNAQSFTSIPLRHDQ